MAGDGAGGLVEEGGLGEGVGDVAEERRAACCGGGVHDAVEGDVEGCVFHRHQFPAEHGAGKGAEEQQAALADFARPVGLRYGRGSGGGVQGVEAAGQAGAEGDRGAAEGLGDGGPLALGVTGDVHAVPEGDRPQGEALREGALALADHPGQQDVGVGEAFYLAVQGERVEGEGGFGVDVTADVDAVCSETTFGEERIRTGGDGGGHAVGGQAQAAAACRGSARSPCGGIEGERHLLLGRLVFAGGGGGFGACLGLGFGELASGDLAGVAIGAVGGEQGAGGGAAGAAAGAVLGHGGGSFLRRLPSGGTRRAGAVVGGGGLAADGVAGGELTLADREDRRSLGQSVGAADRVGPGALCGREGVEGVVDAGRGLPQPEVGGGHVASCGWVLGPGGVREPVHKEMEAGQVAVQDVQVCAVGGGVRPRCLAGVVADSGGRGPEVGVRVVGRWVGGVGQVVGPCCRGLCGGSSVTGRCGPGGGLRG